MGWWPRQSPLDSLAEEKGWEPAETEAARAPGTEDQRGESCTEPQTADWYMCVRKPPEVRKEPSRKTRGDSVHTGQEIVPVPRSQTGENT